VLNLNPAVLTNQYPRLELIYYVFIFILLLHFQIKVQGWWIDRYGMEVNRVQKVCSMFL